MKGNVKNIINSRIIFYVGNCILDFGFIFGVNIFLFSNLNIFWGFYLEWGC